VKLAWKAPDGKPNERTVVLVRPTDVELRED
jgi:hypothetical protein